MVLALWNGHKYEAIVVDDKEGCIDQHRLKDHRFHRREDQKGNMWALICPNSLSPDEQTRLVKYSEMQTAMADRALDHLTAAARKRLEERTEARRGWQRL